MALCVSLIVAGVTLVPRESLPTCDAQDLGKSAGGKRELFADWAKPDIALLLSGQMHGYLQPCGCSEPQFGGLARRYNFLESLKDRGWPVVLVDVGDLAQKGGPQAMLKYSTAMQALQLMGYTAVAVGKNEMEMPLIEALANFALNNPSPRVLAANLLDPDGRLQGMVGAVEVSGKDNSPRVGVVALVGPSVARSAKDPTLKFAADNGAVLKKAVGEIAKKADLMVLLYEGTLKEAKSCGEFWARAQKDDPTLAQIHVIQCLSEEEDSSAVPERAGNSMVVAVGHKGRYVGVVGAFRTGKADQPFDLRYQLVSIGPEYKTNGSKDAGNPIVALMEDYTKELKARNYLERFPRTPHPVQIHYPKARYVGSERCADCHERAYEIWNKSKHAQAYQTLVDAQEPSLRQFDGECVVCHVVGFNHPGGFYDKNNAKKDELLKNVGCESCHGPASEHVKNPNNAAMYPILNPWKARPGETPAAANERVLRIDMFCQKCHDVDNDVHWSFAKNWPKIIHTTPRKAAQAK